VTVNTVGSDRHANEIAGDVISADGSVNEGWRLHLIDVNVTMADLLTLARKQVPAYLIP
jgi:hypothetical protein